MKPRPLPVEVDAEKDGAPARLRLKGRWVRVERRMTAWVIQGMWWSSEVRREYMRVLTAVGTVEVYRERGTWWLSRILD